MRKNFRWIVSALFLGWLLAACGSGNETLTSGLANDGATPQSAPLRIGQLRNLSELIPLQGTGWIIESIDFEPHDAAISFAWRAEEGVVVWYQDECTQGQFVTSSTSAGGWIVENDSPTPNCSSPLSRIFSDGAVVEIWLQNPNVLMIRSGASDITATLWQSVSVHDEPALINIDGVDVGPAVVDIALPEYDELVDIPEAIDIALPECAQSGEAGLEVHPQQADFEVTYARLSPVLFDLPFVVGFGSPESLHHHGIGISMTVRYQPTIDWLVENVPAGHVCVEVPPVGYYDDGPSLPEWRFVGEPSPEASSFVVRHRGRCGPKPSLVLEPQVTETDSTIVVALPLRIPPFGQAFNDDCSGHPEFTIELNGPIGERAIVPAQELR